MSHGFSETLVPATLAVLIVSVTPAGAVAQSPRQLMPIDFVNSAEFAWLGKKVHASRPLDDMTQPATWRFTGTGQLTLPEEMGPNGMRGLRGDGRPRTGDPAPTTH